MAPQFGDTNIGDFYQRPQGSTPARSNTPMGDLGMRTAYPVNGSWGPPNGSSGGGVPGGAFYSQPIENGPTLTPNLLGRYGPTERFNYFEIVGDNTSTTSGWVSITVARPTLLITIEQLFGSVYFSPYAIPSTFGSGSALLNALRAEGPGVAYLWAPGIWWLKYNSASTNRAKFLQLTAEDPAIVAAAMSLPGSQKITQSVKTGAVANTAFELAAANPNRRALVIQAMGVTGISTSNPLYVGLNTVAPSSTTFSFALTTNWQSVTYSDEAMNTGVVYGIINTAAFTVNVTEYE